MEVARQMEAVVQWVQRCHPLKAHMHSTCDFCSPAPPGLPLKVLEVTKSNLSPPQVLWTTSQCLLDHRLGTIAHLDGFVCKRTFAS